MFKKSKSKGNIRKRPLSPSAEAAPDSVTLDAENQSDEPVKVYKPAPKPSTANISSSSAPKKRALVEDLSYSASATSTSLVADDMGATAVQEVDTEQDRDATAVLKKQLALQEELKGQADDGVYRGQAGYAKYFEKKDTVAGNVTSSKIRVGPIRASASIRVTSRFDYQPDICKDYKETGYCGWGDSCKFMHDRGDYKSGWQLDKEWDAMTKKKQESELRGEDDEDTKEEDNDEPELPFACLICRKPFTQPIVTKCGHYFCEKCAVKEFKRSPKCFACGQPTLGIFTIAKELMAKLKEKKEREQ